MEANSAVKGAADKMQKAVDFVANEFRSIHTGKASPAMVEGVTVEAYGSTVKLKEVAAITTPDAKTIQVQAWDKGVVDAIVKGIQQANIGLNPVAEGAVIRLPIPELSRERRQELVKSTKTMAEEGKVRVRGARREVLDELKAAQKGGEISEDDLKRLEKDVQTQTDRHIDMITKQLDEKEKELMAV